jgi:PAS domain S-box-containing protein
MSWPVASVRYEDPNIPRSRADRRGLIRRFLLLFLPAALVIGLAVTAAHDWSMAERLDDARFREGTAVAAVAAQLARDLDRVADDVLVLGASPSLRDFLRTGGSTHRRRVAAHFLNLATQARVYDQVRFIDEEGREVIRVNYQDGSPVPVPRRDLQNKSGRYYFEDTLRLASGDVFVSPLDLNVERGAVEIPHRPMIRLGTPVFDSQHRRRGIVLINYLGEALLDRARSAMAGEGALMILNRDGYWLSAPDPADAWGFLLDHGRRFGERYPDAWISLSDSNSDAVLTDDGLFVFATVTPLAVNMRSSDGSAEPFAPSSVRLSGEEYRWKVVSHIDREALTAGAVLPAGKAALLGALLLAGAGCAAWGVAWIAERRRVAEAEERASAARFRLLAEHSSDMIALHSADGRYLYVSPSATRLLGYEPGDLVGRFPDDLLVVDGDATPGFGLWCRPGADGAPPAPGLYRIWRRDGTWIWFETLGSRVPDGAAASAGRFVTVSRDVSERKRTEAELEEQRQRLEDQAVRLGEVAEGLSLARRAAERARAEAESANRAKSEFLASMSHELRTPLNSILGFSEVIRDQVFGPVGMRRYVDYAADIHESGRHLLDLINDVLDLSKIEAGKLELKPTLLDVDTLLDQCIRMVRERADRKNLTLKLIMGKRRPALFADERAVRQIMFNLLSNAVKFTPVDGRIEVSAVQQADASVRIAVSDTGCGIPAAQIARLMLPFEQLDNRFSRDSEGTGLGLAIAKSMAALHNGLLEIDSKEGLGTTASLIFPPAPRSLFAMTANRDRAAALEAV